MVLNIMKVSGFQGIMFRLLIFFLLSLVVIEHINESVLWPVFFLIILIAFILSTIHAFKNLNS